MPSPRAIRLSASSSGLIRRPRHQIDVWFSFIANNEKQGSTKMSFTVRVQRVFVYFIEILHLLSISAVKIVLRDLALLFEGQQIKANDIF